MTFAPCSATPPSANVTPPGCRWRRSVDEVVARREPVAAPAAAARGHLHWQLERATDIAVWDFATAQGYTIVTKDDDFSALSALRGHPPRIIKLTLGNTDNARVLSTLLAHRTQIEERFADASVALVELAPQGK
jgi:predicted nuclease of predicted toxin-antitoxin system